MRLYQILVEDFSWDSEWDEDLYRTLKGLANKNNGVFKSRKQKNFLQKRILAAREDQSPAKARQFFGLNVRDGQYYVILTGISSWANYGSRSKVPVRHGFVLDDIGVVSHTKIGNEGNLRTGSGPDPSKNKLQWTRDETKVNASHLEKSEEERKKEFKAKLGIAEGNYIGEPGQRLDLGTLTLVAKKYVGDSAFGYNQSVPKYWNMYRDEAGNVIYHTGKEGPDKGEKVAGKATIKKHLVSKKGDKVTVVIRPRFVRV